MDERDYEIIALLVTDGRMSHRELAAAAGVSRAAAGARLARMLGSGAVSVRAALHPALLGQLELAHLSLSVTAAASEVAAALAARPDTSLVSITDGDRPVIAELRLRDRASLFAAIEQVRGIPGVDTLETLSYGPILRDVLGPVGPMTAAVDEVDLQLMRLLQADGRASYVALGEAVRLTDAAVRRRVGRLLAGNAIRIGALARHTGFSGQTVSGVAIRLRGDSAPVIDWLIARREVQFLAHSIGWTDLLVTVAETPAGPLLEILDGLRGLPAVAEIRAWRHLRIVKESYAAVTEPPLLR